MAVILRLRRARVTAGLAATAAAGIAVAACTSSAAGSGPSPQSSLQSSYEATITRALPSVVEITAGGTTGSGVVFDNSGDVVTNAHVVGNHTTFEVRSSVVSQTMQARLVGVFSPDDLAVIKVGKGSGQLRPVRWADSDKAQVGQIVLAMGSPYGLTDSVTQGIVSATGRTVTGPGISGHPPTVIVNALQTSAAINPGNSGGALVLLTGHVLGIPTLTATDPAIGGRVEGIGFAIPANTAVSIARQLIERGNGHQVQPGVAGHRGRDSRQRRARARRRRRDPGPVRRCRGGGRHQDRRRHRRRRGAGDTRHRDAGQPAA